MKNQRFAKMKAGKVSLWLVPALALFSTTSCAQDDRPPRPPRGAAQGYSIQQAISDNAQLHTIAFSGLAFVTGDFGACTFMPPGKVCDYFGFQYMRDIDVAQAGHNPKFLSRVAGNVMRTLNDDQAKMFLDLANEQAPQFEQVARLRLSVIKAFCRGLAGDVPAGSTGLNKEAVAKYLAQVYALDGEMSYRRAEVMGKVAQSLSAAQRAFLASMKFGDFSSWPDVDEREQMQRFGPAPSKMYSVAFMTYCSEFFSWYAGSVEADTYFCPERHGTYFGGFYMKDMPAMGKRDFSISLSRTGDSGRDFLAALDESQQSLVTDIIPAQKNDLAEIVKVRRAISTELRKFLDGSQADKAKVLSLSRRYGELDGEMSWMYATAFAKIAKTLTAAEREQLTKIRNLDGYTSAPYYIYSDAMQDNPSLPNTDSFFFPPSKADSGEGSSLPDDAQASTNPDVVATSAAPATEFVLRSPAVADGGQLPKDYTGDGTSSTLPLEWSGAPKGTKSFAVIMHHVAPDGIKWYWVLYDIPASVSRLPRNVIGVGTLGNNSITRKTGYAPPHSKGPGPKVYTYTLYALSAPPRITVPPLKVSRAVLLAAMKRITLGSAEFSVVYTRFPAPDAERGHPHGISSAQLVGR